MDYIGKYFWCKRTYSSDYAMYRIVAYDKFSNTYIAQHVGSQNAYFPIDVSDITFTDDAVQCCESEVARVQKALDTVDAVWRSLKERPQQYRDELHRIFMRYHSAYTNAQFLAQYAQNQRMDTEMYTKEAHDAAKGLRRVQKRMYRYFGESAKTLMNIVENNSHAVYWGAMIRTLQYRIKQIQEQLNSTKGAV